jgi:lipopolysaccharide export system protein LptC
MAVAARLMKTITEFITRRPVLVAWLGVALVGCFIVYFLVTALLMPDAPAIFGQPQIKLHQVQGQGERGTQLGWTFAADSADTSTDGQLTTYHHVRQGVYYLKGKPAYKLTANEVTLDMRSQSYTGSGNVHVWSVRPRDLSDVRTENIIWNNPLQTLTCPTEVHVKYKGFDMVTAHLQANLVNGTSSLGTTSINGTR